MTNTPNASIVRQNLLTRPYYTPYCGADRCPHGMPRTQFNGTQFQCSCGWTSQYEAEFIERVKKARATDATAAPSLEAALERAKELLFSYHQGSPMNESDPVWKFLTEEQNREQGL